MYTLKITAFVALILFAGCNDQVRRVENDKFVGVWELKGRPLFEGIHVRIEQQNGSLAGTIVKLNDNKLIKLFAETGDIWVSEIKRSSNFEFRLIEKKIARELFSLYGLSTSQEFRVQLLMTVLSDW